ncbi:MAG: NAD-dependent epimerase/dehydratase family protein [Lachnospiraceae bacterium]
MENVLIDDFKRVAESDLPFEEFRNRSFLITGATGLIGSLLVRALLYCNRVHDLKLKIYAVVRNVEKARGIFGADTAELEYVVADLAGDEVEGSFDCDYVIHAAAVTTSKLMVSDPVGTIRTAIDGTEKLLKLAVEKKAKSFVYISSMEVYGQPKTEGKTAEKDLGYIDIGTVRSCYPEGKRMCECLCNAYASQYGLNVKSARLAQTFGAGILPTENRVFAQFAKSAMNGEDIVLHTTGESEGNYVYTADAVRAILLLLVKGASGEAYNIANEESHTTIRNMAELVAEKIAGNVIRVVLDIPEDGSALGYAPPVKMWLDASKMRSLGWEPEVSLTDSYRRMIAYMKEQGE